MACSHCGQSLETDARFCPQCGAQVSIHETTVEEGNLSPIQEDGMMVSTKPRPHAKKRFGWLTIPFVVIVGVLIVGGLGGGWYYYRHNIQPEQEAIQAINEFFEALDESAKQVNQATTLAELNRLCRSLSPYVEKIESLPAEGDSEVASFVRELKANGRYRVFVRGYVSGNTLTGGVLELIYGPDMLVNSAKTLVEKVMNHVLEIQRPAWVESID